MLIAFQTNKTKKQKTALNVGRVNDKRRGSSKLALARATVVAAAVAAEAVKAVFPFSVERLADVCAAAVLFKTM